MDLSDYWTKKLAIYSQQDWSNQPNIFATEAMEYFPKHGKILDLAAGIGQDSKYFSNLGYEVTSTDLVPPSQIVDLNFPLPFPLNSFEIIYSHLGLHFFTIHRTQSLFQETFNIIKPNGIFCATLNSTSDPEILESTKIDTDYYQTPSGLVKRFFSTESLKQLLSADFKILLLDDNGKTFKDGDNCLIRLVCQK